MTPMPLLTNAAANLIQSWSPITTRLLRLGGSSAWNVMDNVMTTTTATDDFMQSLLSELDEFFPRLSPARTKGEVQARRLMFSMMHSRLFDPNDNASSGSEDRSQQFACNAMNTPPTIRHPTTTPVLSAAAAAAIAAGGSGRSSVRGDSCAFISRQDRLLPEFQQTHPQLTELVRAVETTVRHHLLDYIAFDPAATSVQLAVYPGDEKSGYPRHCDRGQGACGEQKQKGDDQNANATASTSSTASQRIITCVYYLTPDDWDVELDGGCLRLFGGAGGKDQYFDVAPYRNRLVVFRSDCVEHQVMPSLRRPRVALTIWLCGTTTTTATSTTTATTTKSSKEYTPATANAPTLSPMAEDDTIHSNQQVDDNDDNTSLGPPPLPLTINESTSSSANLATIFVSLAAYRDSETGPTIRSLLTRARHPERVSVGVVMQVDAWTNQDQHVVDGFMQCAVQSSSPGRTVAAAAASKIRWLTLDARHAQGPCYARFLCQSLFRGEDYTMQIDAHMRFRHNWDCYLIQQLDICRRSRRLAGNNSYDDHNDDKVMLTTYPVGYHLPDQVPNECRGTLLVPWKFDANGMLRQRGRLLSSLSSSPQEPPIPCLLYAAGFNFSPARVLQDCPYNNDQLRHLFFGEEMSMAVRLYTHGYQLFAPRESVCYHLWSRTQGNRSSTALSSTTTGSSSSGNHYNNHTTNEQVVQQRDALRAAARQVVHDQLRGCGPGLGTVRSAAAFLQALGIDVERQLLLPGAEWGGLSSGNFAAAFDVGEERQPANTATLQDVVQEGSGSSIVEFTGFDTVSCWTVRMSQLEGHPRQLISSFLQNLERQ